MTLDAIVRWFETLTRESVTEVGRYYTDAAIFKDPFNEVQGIAAIERVFAHMFDQVGEPRFAIVARWEGEAGAMLLWDFTFRMPGRVKPREIRGVSHLRFAADGRIDFHRDYWDAAGELYEHLPVLGALMGLVRRRLRAG
jgi:steroid delta-isomerase